MCSPVASGHCLISQTPLIRMYHLWIRIHYPLVEDNFLSGRYHTTHIQSASPLLLLYDHWLLHLSSEIAFQRDTVKDYQFTTLIFLWICLNMRALSPIIYQLFFSETDNLAVEESYIILFQPHIIHTVIYDILIYDKLRSSLFWKSFLHS